MQKNGYIIILGCRKCGKCDGVCDTGALERVDGIVRIKTLFPVAI